MSNGYQEVLGSWITAIGTILAALSVTPVIVGEDIFLEEDNETEDKKRRLALSDNLAFIGNTFQGVGNALEAEAEKPYALEKAGEFIQAAGNTTVLFSIVEENENKKIRLDITGNSLQAFGGLIAGLDELIEYTDDFYIDAIGNFLQAIGNTTQAIGSLTFLETGDAELLRLLVYSGSWIQASGAIVALYGTIKEAAKSKNGQQEEKDDVKQLVERYGYG